MNDVSMERQIVAGCDEDVVHEDKQHAQVFVFQGAEQTVHRLLERRWRVCQAKVHDIWLIQSIRRLKCRFVAIFWLDLYIVIAPTDVEGGEEHLALKLFENVGDLGNQIDISNCPLVNFLVVLYWS